MRKIEQGNALEDYGGATVIWVVREGLIKKVIFELRPEARRESRHREQQRSSALSLACVRAGASPVITAGV